MNKKKQKRTKTTAEKQRKPISVKQLPPLKSDDIPSRGGKRAVKED